MINPQDLEDFGSTLDDHLESNDDEDYDAFNNETFGDVPASDDWEENHKRFSELDISKRSVNQEQQKKTSEYEAKDLPAKETKSERDVRLIGESAAAFILDDDEEDEFESSDSRTTFSNDEWVPDISPRIMTVEEIEAAMRKNVHSQNESIKKSSGWTEEEKADQKLDCQNQYYNLRNIQNNRRRYHQNVPTPEFNPPRFRQQFNLGLQYPQMRMQFPSPSGPPVMMPPHCPQPHQRPERMVYHPNQYFHPRHGQPPRMQRAEYQQVPLGTPPHDRISSLTYANKQRNYDVLSPNAATEDEYSGLMTQQEKQWLSSIQLIQLCGNEPLEDDYYNVMFSQRQQGNVARKIGSFSIQCVTPKPTYTPQQFENSLGKLQVGSVNAPRKIIDMDVVESQNLDAHAKHSDKKTKQLLIEVEELYKSLLKVEEANNPLFNKGHSRENDEEILTLKERMLATLLQENKLMSVMSLKKGKKLVLRLLPLLSNATPLVSILLFHLEPITRRDVDQILLSFLPYLRNFLLSATLTTLNEIVKCYELKFFFSNKFTISVMANIIERAAHAVKDAPDEDVQQWIKLLMGLAESAVHWIENERPVVAVERSLLVQHLTLIESEARDEHISALIKSFSNFHSEA